MEKEHGTISYRMTKRVMSDLNIRQLKNTIQDTIFVLFSKLVTFFHYFEYNS